MVVVREVNLCLEGDNSSVGGSRSSLEGGSSSGNKWLIDLRNQRDHT